MYTDDILLSHPFDSLSEPCLILTQFLPGSLPTILLLTLPKPNTCSSLSNPHLAFPSLYLNDSPLELVSSYGVFLSSNLSWLLHIRQIRSKLIGFLFCYFYCFSSPTVLFKLYLSLIRPHLEYCSSVWDTSSSTLISSLEKLQHFALKLCSKQRSSSYTSLLQLFHCPSLSVRLKQSKLIFSLQSS